MNTGNYYVHREPLTSDVIFKAVFGQECPDSKAALIQLLNLVLNRKENPIVDLVYKNSFSITEAENEKVIIMDIKVETSNGELIDIEMQVGNLDFYINRSVYYGCNQIVKGLEKGEDYDKMKKSIIISFVKGILFPNTRAFHSVNTLCERNTGEELTNLLQLHYIELDKINCRLCVKDLGPLEQFGAYMKCTGNPYETDFIERLIQEGEKVISMTDSVLKKVSEEEKLYHLRMSREMKEMEIRVGLNANFTKGMNQKAEEIAIKMKQAKEPVEKIMDYTGLTEGEIKTL